MAQPSDDHENEHDPKSIRGLGCIPVSTMVGSALCGVLGFTWGCDLGELGRQSRESSAILGLIVGGILGTIVGALIWALFPYKSIDK